MLNLRLAQPASSGSLLAIQHLRLGGSSVADRDPLIQKEIVSEDPA
jgi:hypothetical protein